MSSSLKSNWFHLKYSKLMKSVRKRKNSKQLDFLEYVAKMDDWEFRVFDAFRARLRVDELKDGSLSKKAYDYFVSNPNNEVSQLLTSVDLHGWRPVGVTIFAELIKLDKARNDDAIIQAIEKASIIGRKSFKEEYPIATKSSPKDILMTILKDDFNIILQVKVPEQKAQYDALRQTDEDKISA